MASHTSPIEHVFRPIGEPLFKTSASAVQVFVPQSSEQLFKYRFPTDSETFVGNTEFSKWTVPTTNGPTSVDELATFLSRRAQAELRGDVLPPPFLAVKASRDSKVLALHTEYQNKYGYRVLVGIADYVAVGDVIMNGSDAGMNASDVLPNNRYLLFVHKDFCRITSSVNIFGLKLENLEYGGFYPEEKFYDHSLYTSLGMSFSSKHVVLVLKCMFQPVFETPDHRAVWTDGSSLFHNVKYISTVAADSGASFINAGLRVPRVCQLPQESYAGRHTLLPLQSASQALGLLLDGIYASGNNLESYFTAYMQWVGIAKQNDFECDVAEYPELNQLKFINSASPMTMGITRRALRKLFDEQLQQLIENQEEAKEGAEENVAEGAQEGADEGAQEGADEGAQEGADEGAQEGAQENDNENAQENDNENADGDNDIIATRRRNVIIAIVISVVVLALLSTIVPLVVMLRK